VPLTIGLIVGGIALLALCELIWWCYRRIKTAKPPAPANSDAGMSLQVVDPSEVLQWHYVSEPAEPSGSHVRTS